MAAELEPAKTRARLGPSLGAAGKIRVFGLQCCHLAFLWPLMVFPTRQVLLAHLPPSTLLPKHGHQQLLQASSGAERRGPERTVGRIVALQSPPEREKALALQVAPGPCQEGLGIEQEYALSTAWPGTSAPFPVIVCAYTYNGINTDTMV